MPFCTNCGDPVAPGAGFCAACGTETGESADRTGPFNRNQRCDLCGKHLRGEGTLVSPEEMRIIAGNDYGRNLTHMGWGAASDSERNQKLYQIAMVSNDDWRLCNRCFKHTRKYAVDDPQGGASHEMARALLIKPLVEKVGSTLAALPDRTASLPADDHPCDLCRNTSESRSVMPAGELKKTVPSMANEQLMPLLQRIGAASKKGAKRLRQRIQTRKDDWRLCPSCLDDLRPMQQAGIDRLASNASNSGDDYTLQLERWRRRLLNVRGLRSRCADGYRCGPIAQTLAERRAYGDLLLIDTRRAS